MPQIESRISINAPFEKVWQLAQDVENLPQILPDLDNVLVHQREERANGELFTVTEWHGRIKQFNRKVVWTEEDVWNAQNGTCTFQQTKGDFDAYSGVWTFSKNGDATDLHLSVNYEFNIPLVGALMQKVVQKLMQDNSDGMLKALKEAAEK
jgi:ribosome-associated toxin RatA of RatAB toxin-antitoxin module